MPFFSKTTLGTAEEIVIFEDNFERESIAGKGWEMDPPNNTNEYEASIVTDPTTSNNRVLKLWKRATAYIRATKTFPTSPTEAVLRFHFYDPVEGTSSAYPGLFLTLRNKELAAESSVVGIEAKNNYYSLRIFNFDNTGTNKIVPPGVPCVSQTDQAYIFRTGRVRGWHTVDFVVTNSGTYVKFDGSVITKPYTESSNWNQQHTNRLYVCFHPQLTQAKSLNFIVTWGDGRTSGTFYFDNVRFVSPPSDPFRLLENISDWYLEKYNEPSSPHYLASGYERIFSTVAASSRNIQHVNEAISLFDDVGVKAFKCRQGETRLCQRAIDDLKAILYKDKYEYVIIENNEPKTITIRYPFSQHEWRNLDRWRVLPLGTERLVMIYELLRPRLSNDLKSEITERVKIAFEKLRYLQPGDCDGTGGRWPGMYDQSDVGNTCAEENAWFSLFFAAAYNHLKKYQPNYPYLQEASNKARCFAYHSLTTEEDRQTASCPEVITKTVYRHHIYPYPPPTPTPTISPYPTPTPTPTPTPDATGRYFREPNTGRYFLVNHHMIHPNYMAATIGVLGRAAYYYLLINRERPPEEFSHHVVDLWNEFWVKQDGEICNNENECSEAHPECCAFIDRNTFFFRRNIERFQGGLLIAGPLVLYFLDYPLNISDIPNETFFLQRKFLFQYKTPMADVPVGSGGWLGAWVNDATVTSSYIAGWLMKALGREPLPSLTPVPSRRPTPTGTPPPCVDYYQGNINCDPQLIDEADLGLLLARWTSGATVSPTGFEDFLMGDLNNDRKIDEKDLTILLSNWRSGG